MTQTNPTTQKLEYFPHLNFFYTPNVNIMVRMNASPRLSPNSGMKNMPSPMLATIPIQPITFPPNLQLKQYFECQFSISNINIRHDLHFKWSKFGSLNKIMHQNGTPWPKHFHSDFIHTNWMHWCILSSNLASRYSLSIRVMTHFFHVFSLLTNRIRW